MTGLAKLGIYAAIALVIAGVCYLAWSAVDGWCNGACATAKGELAALKVQNALDEKARTDLAAKKEAERERVENDLREEARRASESAGRAAADAERAEKERRAALVRLGGVVRDLADARSVLAAGDARRAAGGAAAEAPAAPLRGDDADSGADLARRLAACRADLTVLTATMSVNRTNHERALAARDTCVALYNKAAARINEE